MANSAAMLSAERAPLGWYQCPIQFKEPAMAKADNLTSQDLIERSAMPSLI
jgi:hypothetical protein